jgi:hypothetical protein
MRSALTLYLADVHCLLRDEQRDRGCRPGPLLELDMERLANTRWLHAERRVRRGPYGGVYYSGLAPETDLFVYDGPQFLHVEAKDFCGSVGRAIPTEFWARALDLHLGRSRDTLPESPRDHYPVLVVSSDANDQMRRACLRWGICLVEPTRIPLVVLASLLECLGDSLDLAGCATGDLSWACLPFNRRFPREEGGVLLPLGRLASQRPIEALLRFQRIASRKIALSPADQRLTA